MPPSLVDVLREVGSDLGLAPPAGGSLKAWARHGVLLLNTLLTVREGSPLSHRRAWRPFTDALIQTVAARPHPIVFLLWGRHAQAKTRLIDDSRHVVLMATYPSPRSARGFLGRRPFSAANAELERRGVGPIDWRLGGAAEVVEPGGRNRWTARGPLRRARNAR